MTWFVAMLAVLAFMLMQRACDGWPVHKLRTWASMFASSALAWSIPYMSLTSIVACFIVIDTMAGFVVMVRPAGAAQKAIGFLYFIMILQHIAVAIASLKGPVNTASYEAGLTFAGWSQFAILLAWSGWDVGGFALHRLGRWWSGHSSAPVKGKAG
jgi:hypothetical protein